MMCFHSAADKQYHAYTKRYGLTYALILFSLVWTTSACSSNANLVESFAPWAKNPAANCALGIAKHHGNQSLSKTGATSRARDALARQLETKVKGLIKDYQSQGETAGTGFSEELITQVSKQSVQQVLIGTRVKQGRLNPEQTEYYALVCIETESILKAFDAMKRFNRKQRQDLRARAREAFRELDQQSMRR